MISTICRALGCAILFTAICLCGCKKKISAPSNPKGIATAKWVDNFTWVQSGTMPLVISVPHGGTIAPDSIADRTCPSITTAVDLYTIEMVKAIDSVAFADYGLHPFIVYTNLKRIKLDQNRDLPEATCNNSNAYNYWYNFHNAVDTCLQKARLRYNECLYIDLHAHGHALQRLELGYLVNKVGLQNLPSVLPATTSLAKLIVTNSSLSLSQLLVGDSSFGSMMNANGFPSVPSNLFPAPATADSYFDGGYNTQRYTSLNNVFGWQIESNFTGVRENATQRGLFAKAFLRSINTFYTSFTKLQPSQFGY